MVELIEQQHVAVLITAFDGEIAHQAEQVANKLSLPVITLSGDRTTAQNNIPWIFRLGPTDTDQAQLMTAEIAAHSTHENILPVSEADHDGRIGAREFLNAAKHSCPLASVQSLQTNSSSWVENFWQQQIKMIQPDVLVLWTNPESAFRLLAIARSYRQDTLALLSRKAEQYSASDTPAVYSESRGVSQNHQQIEHEFVVFFGGRVNIAGDLSDLNSSETANDKFAIPQIYLAVRIAVSALRHTGPNRARLEIICRPAHRSFAPAMAQFKSHSIQPAIVWLTLFLCLAASWLQLRTRRTPSRKATCRSAHSISRDY
jgi:hypothetical protein